MKKVFISGSMKIKNLDPLVLKRIDNIIEQGYIILVGDADGVDSSVQEYLKSHSYNNVFVYCTGSQPRNNIGSWEVKKVETTAQPGTRAYFTVKDIEMSVDCDYGLMIWDTKSTGTLSNVLELLQRKKNSLVFVNKSKIFEKVKDVTGLEQILTHMSEFSLKKADAKLKVQDKILSLKNEQSALF